MTRILLHTYTALGIMDPVVQIKANDSNGEYGIYYDAVYIYSK